MNKFFQFIITLFVVLLMITPFALFAYGLGEVRENNQEVCSNLCHENDMEFFDYDTLIAREDLFCECLNNGTMKKFLFEVDDDAD